MTETQNSGLSLGEKHELVIDVAQYICRNGWSPEEAREIVPMNDTQFDLVCKWYEAFAARRAI